MIKKMRVGGGISAFFGFGGKFDISSLSTKKGQ